MKIQFQKIQVVNAFKKIIISLFLLGFFISFIYNLLKIYTNSFVINQSDIYDIGEFYNQGRSFRKLSSRSSGEVFKIELINGFYFEIDNETLNSIEKRKELMDLLSKQNLKFRVFTNEKTSNKYKEMVDDFQTRKGKIFSNNQMLEEEFKVQVVQIQVDGHNFVNISKLNRELYSNIKHNLLLNSIFFVILLGVQIYRFRLKPT